MKIVNLKRLADADDYPIAQQGQPLYPYMSLCIGDDVLDALGIDTLPPTGTVVTIEARAVVETAHDPVDAGNMLDGRRLHVQIVAMGMDVPKTGRTPGRRVYGDDD